MNKLLWTAALVALIVKSEIFSLIVLLAIGLAWLYRIMSDRRY